MGGAGLHVRLQACRIRAINDGSARGSGPDSPGDRCPDRPAGGVVPGQEAGD